MIFPSHKNYDKWKSIFNSMIHFDAFQKKKTSVSNKYVTRQTIMTIITNSIYHPSQKKVSPNYYIEDTKQSMLWVNF